MKELELERLRAITGSADDFRTLADGMPQLVWTALPNGTVDYFNARWRNYTGSTLEQLTSPEQFACMVHPDDAADTAARWTAAVASATPFEMEYRLPRASDGSYRWFISRAEPVFDRKGRVTRWVGAATDIDEQRRSRDSLQFVVRAGEVLSPASDVASICNALAHVTVEAFADWCFVTLDAEPRTRTVASAHTDPARKQEIEEYCKRFPDSLRYSIARVARENKPSLLQQVATQEHAPYVHSLILVPLSTPDGTAYGTAGIVSAESRHLFSDADLAVAQAVARRAAAAIENVQALAGERLISHRLRFMSRINELLLDASDFWSSMERIARMIVDEISDGCLIARVDGDVIRTEVAVHRDPAANAVVSTLKGQRTLLPEPERELAQQLRRHQTYVRQGDDFAALKSITWPFLAQHVEALAGQASVIVPLYSSHATYGAIAAYFSNQIFDPQRDCALLEEIAARASVAVERAETMERERRIATTLQKASLPTVIPRSKGLRFNAVYAPAGEEAEVGGDWYDVVEMDDGSVVINVGDVTGRGIGAAAIMSKVRHAMGIVPRHESDPAKILDSAEWFLRKRYPDAIVTAFVGIISPDRRRLRFANAGHPPPILRRGGTLETLDGPSLPLGLRHMAPHQAGHSAELRDGDLLVLYTDGLVEWGRDWSQGLEDLERVLHTDAVWASIAPADLIHRTCLPGKAHDDVAILTVQLGEAPIWSFSAEDARAAVDARPSFVSFLRDYMPDADALVRAELIFGELLGNVVRHAPGLVEISVFQRGSKIELHVIDSGSQFCADPRLPNDILSELGRGTFIITQLARELRVEHVAGCGNHVTVLL